MNEFGDTDVDNRLVGTAGEGESGKDGETSTNTCTLSAVRCISGEKLPCSRMSPVMLCGDLEGWDTRRGGRLERDV